MENDMDKPIQPIDYQEDFIQYIYDSTIVPVISNGFRLEEIFRDDEELCKAMMKDVPQFYDEVRTISQQLTKQWAAEVVHYPMSDDHNLARVAQYFQVTKADSEKAKKGYLKFLNDRLLKINHNREGYEDIVSQHQKSIQQLNFTKLVRELDLPRFPERTDPLKLLAKLPLPIYITTSYFRFIEEALKSEGKKPSTQYWSWSGGKSSIKLEYLADPEIIRGDKDKPIPPNPRDYEPDAMNPVVYHIFGMENFAKTLVISEDDYMNFLMYASESISSLEIVPSPIRDALSEKRLLLLGYHLRDWDFRALFRFISKFRNREHSAVSQSIAIQLMPNLQNKEFEHQSLQYLENYFKDYKFEIKWIDTEKFIYELVDTWTGGH
jgi:hypothetical protein